MADGLPSVDTSSYPKPTPAPSVLDTVGKLQGLENNATAIDQNKLQLINDRWKVVNRELQGLLGDPDVDFNKVAGRFQNLVNLGLIPSQMMAQSLQDVPTDKARVRDWLKMHALQGSTIMEALNAVHGAPGLQSQGQQLVQTRTGVFVPGGVQRDPQGKPIQLQAPPTTEITDTNERLPNGEPNPAFNQKRLLGPQAEQPTPRTGALPVGPVNNPAINGPSANFGGTVTGATVGPNQVVQNRFPAPSGLPTGLPPGVSEAQAATGLASGTQLAQDRTRAAAFQRDIFPLNEAIPALEKLGTKGTGPGTETINHLKSFLLSNVPGVKESDFEGLDNIKTYDKARKYLTDYVNQTGNTGTNDKLAAAFAGNPSVGISNAAAVDVAKSALALRRMQQAQVMEFEKSGMRADQYSQWLAKRTQELDPRAFGVDMMKEEAKKKLLTQLNKNPKERERFEKSLEIAHGLGFLTPTQQ